MKWYLTIGFIVLTIHTYAQEDTSEVEAVRNVVELAEVVVRSDLNVTRFLQRVKDDTTYFKAFKNLHLLGYDSYNFIQMRDKKGRAKASLQSHTRQKVSGGCRTMEVIEEKTTGDFYERDGDYEYYTADLYAAFFFTKEKICGDNNIVKGSGISVKNKKGLDKNREQLRMLFFHPGQKIPGIPFIGDKMDVFDKDITKYYDYSIDTAEVNGQPCYIFTINRKEGLSAGEKGAVVFDNITTWFNQKTMEIVGRNYDMSYDAGIYDFDIHMQVEMTKVGSYLVPQVLRYNGNWFLFGKGRERGIFTATLSNFKLP
jgi:hypothetical protein